MRRKYLIFWFLSWQICVFAQEEIPRNQFWVTGGVGHSISEAFIQNMGLVAGVGFTYNYKQQLASLQINQFQETNRTDKMQGEFNEWKLQYGWIHTKKKDQFFVKGGVAFTECNHFREVFRGDGLAIQKEVSTETAWGLVAETGVHFILNRHVGLGISTFANFNKNALTGGYQINLLVGLFNDYK